MVSEVSGTLTRIDENILAQIKAIPTNIGMGIFPKIGTKISKTINCFSTAGFVLLVHEDNSVVIADYEHIHNLISKGLFVCDNA